MFVDIGSVVYQRAINELGEMLIVAHTAARKLIGIMMMPLASIATAFSTFTSQNWGAGKTERIRQTLKKVGDGGKLGTVLLPCNLLAWRYRRADAYWHYRSAGD